MSPRVGRAARRARLQAGWGFWCCCPLCRDPGEAGTLAAGLACRPRCPGPLLPAAPLNMDSVWVCSWCPDTLTAAAADTRLEEAGQLLEGGVELEGLELALARVTTRLLHPSHSLVLRAQERLLQLYLAAAGRSGLGRPGRERLVQLGHAALLHGEGEQLGLRRRLVECEICNALQNYRAGGGGRARLKSLLCQQKALQVLLAARSHRAGQQQPA